MPRARVRVPGRTQKKRQCRVRWGWAGRSVLFKAALSFARAALWCGQFCAGWPRHRPPPHAAFRTRCTRTVQRVRSEAHYAAAVPRLARLASGGGPGKAGQSAALPCRSHRSARGHHPTEAKPGFPHVVRIRADIFLRRGKCPKCSVRWGETGRSVFLKAALFFIRAPPWQKKCLPVFADHGEAVKGYRFGVRRNHVQNNGCGSVFCDFSIPIT